jgi:hypothetical protein
VKLAARWLVLATALNLGWEVGQLPLYTLYEEAELAALAYAIAHCTAGDVLIAFASYCLAASITRSWHWPAKHASTGLCAALVAGVSYTAFSEWRNVYVLGSWAYTDAMPRVFDIGLSPLLQWILVPVTATALVRFLDPHQNRAAKAG